MDILFRMIVKFEKILGLSGFEPGVLGLPAQRVTYWAISAAERNDSGSVYIMNCASALSTSRLCVHVVSPLPTLAGSEGPTCTVESGLC